ncbi:hypothetical protein SAMN02745221_01328 [Thermosyntropha lipolytica DSM 11003]|uniref:Cell division protein FtsL n=1 Tax=Thermosyntropha lipolytica DSM 11003 TaxID=1123382 RepID=A0A1M5P0C1_9FIRM|nr:hypothetical protein [Thermosyntropha lipolytica]SHG94653.1 hypothetical protein SAMN02745221_01328 [Thermosyntropha lipolytica DSM 11003]
MIQAGYKYEYYSDYATNTEEAYYQKPCYSSKANSLKAQKKKTLCKIIGIFFMYAVVLVYLCVKSAVLGYQIVELEKEIHNIENENLRIQYLTENSCSLEMVEKIASKELGMIKPDARMTVAALPVEVQVKAPERIALSEQNDGKGEKEEKPLYKLYSNLVFLADKSR